MPDERHRRTVLHDAATDGDVAAVTAAISSGAPIDAVDDQGHTALALAATSQNVAATRLLLEAGADTEITNRHGNTALWAAVFNSRDDQTIVRLLLGAGAHRDHANTAGRTPRDLAVTIANYDITELQ